jgi:hypothetical protein
MAVEKKPTCFFFVEQGGFTQSNLQAFGPIAGNEYNEFRVTAKFSCANTVKAFSICKGVVLIQPQAGSSTKVNLVLRPFNQPYPGLNIKYFVYRGLRRSDFFTTGTDPLVKPHTNNVTSDFIKKVNADFDSFYSEPIKDTNGNVIPKPAFSAKFIGFDASIPDITLLSDLFFKESVFTTVGGNTTETTPFELPLIDEGKWLGNFEAGDCGIDVVLNYGDYKYEFDNGEFVFDLGYARVAEAIINGGSGTAYEKKLKREQSNQFVDIAAFFGLFVDEGIVRSYSGTTLQSKEGLPIYDDLLSSFDTKNRFYIYIETERERSYNFYGNYSISPASNESIKVGVSEMSLAISEYGHFGWPLLVKTQQQTGGGSRNNTFLQLRSNKAHLCALYVEIGTTNLNEGGDFYGYQQLLTGNVSESFTVPFVVSTTSSTDGKNVVSLTKLVFVGCKCPFQLGSGIDPNGNTLSIVTDLNEIDAIFKLLRVKSLFSSTSDELTVKSKKIAILTHEKNNEVIGASALEACRIIDKVSKGSTGGFLKRVTFFAEARSISTNLASATAKLDYHQNSSTSTKGNATNSLNVLLPKLTRELFDDGSITVTGLKFLKNESLEPAGVMLGLTYEECGRIQLLINNNLKNVFLHFLEKTKVNLITPDKGSLSYKKYELAIVGEELDSLVLIKPSDPIIIYTIDGHCFFSDLYSKFLPASTVEEKNFIEK